MYNRQLAISFLSPRSTLLRIALIGSLSMSLSGVQAQIDLKAMLITLMQEQRHRVKDDQNQELAKPNDPILKSRLHKELVASAGTILIYIQNYGASETVQQHAQQLYLRALYLDIDTDYNDAYVEYQQCEAICKNSPSIQWEDGTMLETLVHNKLSQLTPPAPALVPIVEQSHAPKPHNVHVITGDPTPNLHGL